MRGHKIVREPGLRIIERGGPYPWEAMAAFLEASAALALQDLLDAGAHDTPTFFDRGIFDAASGLAARRRIPIQNVLPERFPYALPVFFCPPWEEIYQTTKQRRHEFHTAQIEASQLRDDLACLDIECAVLPKISVSERCDWLLDRIAVPQT